MQNANEGDDVGEGEEDNCDAVEKISWSQYFTRGMIAGFLMGFSGGFLTGFICWRVRVHKESQHLRVKI